MGCDIHPYLQWTQDYGYGPSTSSWKLYGDRNYLLFGVLTNGNVRIEDTAGFAPDPRGVPDHLDYRIADEWGLYVLKPGHEGYDCWDSDPTTKREDAIKYAERYHSRFFRNRREDGLEYWNIKDKHTNAHEDGGPPINEYWSIEHPDWHTASWLDADELATALNGYDELVRGNPLSFDHFDKVDRIAEWRGIAGAMKHLKLAGAYPQVVFWFDN